MNRRTLKKNIRYICGDVVSQCLFATHCLPGAKQDEFNDVILKTARLQTTSLRRTSVTFDKAPKDFETKAKYNKARREYYSKAFKSLETDFNKQLQEIVGEMNKALPVKKTK
ncbi:MAG: hypothetical protein HDR74_09915 [Bacteroides sp.]|nr:hypothetical protein [Bacteroides sp.]MDE5808674.1 hypothetical protein [Muribaculaceae bacterium]